MWCSSDKRKWLMTAYRMPAPWKAWRRRWQGGQKTVKGTSSHQYYISHHLPWLWQRLKQFCTSPPWKHFQLSSNTTLFILLYFTSFPLQSPLLVLLLKVELLKGSVLKSCFLWLWATKWSYLHADDSQISISSQDFCLQLHSYCNLTNPYSHWDV